MEDYGQLGKIVEDTINQTIETRNFDLFGFLQNMETEFKILGFREPTARRGGVQKILILRLDAVGDFILLTPSIRAIRENFPRAYITLAVTKPVYPLAELCPYVNEVIAFEMSYKSSVDNKDLLQILRAVTNFSAKYLWRNHFDICFNFLEDLTHQIMSYISGAKMRGGMGGGVFDVLINKPVSLDYSIISHWCDINLYVVQACGLEINSKELEIWYDTEDLRIAKNLLSDFAPNRVKIVVGLGANHIERRYSVEKYLIAFKEIIKRGAAIIILGGPSEVDDAKFLEDNLPKEFVKNLVEVRAGWRADAAVISICDMYIGNDTGTKHVAAALKKPVIVLSRDSKDHERVMSYYCEHIRFAPYATKSITLQPEHPLGDCAKNLNDACHAGKPHCITQIKPEEIVEAYEKILR